MYVCMRRRQRASAADGDGLLSLHHTLVTLEFGMYFTVLSDARARDPRIVTNDDVDTR